MAHELSRAEVLERLKAYPLDRVDVTAELMKASELLSRDLESIFATLDSKAMSLIAYAAAILAFLVARVSELSTASSTAEKWVAIACVMGAAIAIGAGFVAVRVSEWRAISDKELFLAEAFDHVERLRRHYLLQMHAAATVNRASCRRKGHAVSIAQFAVAISALCLAAVVLINLAPVLSGSS